jgi:pilus assembly protein CpaB
MNRAQLIGVAIAAVCGITAFVGVRSLIDKPAPVQREEATVKTAQVLVARRDIGLGDVIGADSLRWQEWPESGLNKEFIQHKTRPGAVADLSGTIARAPMVQGEPVTATKFVKLGEGGVLSAILPQGMRAISTRIREETGAGRMILPNDRVDVILVLRRRNKMGQEEFDTELLFQNIRVLAIGQMIEARDAKKLAEGNTATLELTLPQAEALASANARGEITFALRSIADLKAPPDRMVGDERPDTSVKMLRYGKFLGSRSN